jgi:putative transposase
MPRRARLRVTGYPLHLIQRGHNRSACFRAAGDYLRYLSLLQEFSDRFGCDVHAYVLMTNHVHLLLTPACADGPSMLMKHLGQLYSQYVNRVYERSGTLWEGRFRSSIVQSERYFLCCSRYIELNPVRAGMVEHPRDYPWSSFAANSNASTSAFVVPHDEYLALGQDQVARAAAYRSMFESEPGSQETEEVRTAINGGFALGDDPFRQTVGNMLGRRAGRGQAGRPRKK